MNFKGVENRFREQIRSFLNQKDFIEYSDSHLIFSNMDSDRVEMRISFNIKGYEYDDFSIQSLFMLTFQTVEDHWMPYREILLEDHQPYPHTLGFSLDYLFPEIDTGYHKPFGRGRIQIKAEDDITNYTKLFKTKFFPEIEQFYKAAKNLAWLDNLFNKEPLIFQEICPPANINGLEFRKIIVAYLANNPRFDEIYHIIRNDSKELSATDEYMAKIVDVLDKLYQDLKLRIE